MMNLLSKSSLSTRGASAPHFFERVLTFGAIWCIYNREDAIKGLQT